MKRYKDAPINERIEKMNRNKELKMCATSRIFARTHKELTSTEANTQYLDEQFLKEIRESLLNFPESRITIEKLKQYRQEIIDTIGDLYRITRYFSIVFDWSFHQVMLYKATNIKEAPIPAQDVYRIHMQSLMGLAKDVVSEEETANFVWGLIDEFMVMLPLRMTKEVYHDYLRKGFNILQNLYGEEVDVINIKCGEFKILGDMLSKNPVKLHDSCKPFKEELDKYWNKEVDYENKKQVRKQIEELTELENKIKECATFSFNLVDGVCAALLLTEFGEEKDFEELARWMGKDEKTQDMAIQEILFEVDASELELEEEERDNYFDGFYYESGLDYFTIAKDETERDAEDAIQLIAECTKDQPNRKKRHIRQFCMRGMSFFDSSDFKDYEDYFVKTYQSLDDFNKKLVAACSEYFDITISSRFSNEDEK